MPARTLTAFALLTCALLSPAWGAEAPHVLARSTESYFGGGVTLTLWSDGYAEEVAVAGGPRTESHHWSGRMSPAELGAVQKLLAETKLAQARYAQPDDPNLLTEGGSNLEIWDGERLHDLRPPRVGEPTPATEALTKRMEAARGALREALLPHLDQAGPAGAYVAVVLAGPTKAVGQSPADLPAPVRAALERPGSYSRLPAEHAAEVKQGQRVTVSGRKVIYLVRELGHAKAPGAAPGK